MGTTACEGRGFMGGVGVSGQGTRGGCVCHLVPVQRLSRRLYPMNVVGFNGQGPLTSLAPFSQGEDGEEARRGGFHARGQ